MRRARSEDGVTIVEAAFVIPILFAFVFGLIDLGLWSLDKSQATSAARDGARAAIVLPLAINSTEAASRAKVGAAVEARITEDVVGVDIQCDRDGDGPLGYAACWSNTTTDVILADYGVGRVRVIVTWDRPFLTPVGDLFGTSQQIRGESSMVIVGAPA